jgi:hypothetical protein
MLDHITFKIPDSVNTSQSDSDISLFIKVAGGIKSLIHDQLFTLSESILSDPESTSSFFEQAFQSSVGSEALLQSLVEVCTQYQARLVTIMQYLQKLIINFLGSRGGAGGAKAMQVTNDLRRVIEVSVIKDTQKMVNFINDLRMVQQFLVQN